MKINSERIPGIGANGKYIDDNRTPGQERVGTVLQANVFNQIIDEFQGNFIEAAGLVPSDTDTGQIKKAFDFFINNLRLEFQEEMYDNLSGNIFAFAGDVENIPSNAFLADGREISRITYARLFNKIGTLWGDGDGSTTFNIPDGRGGVLKGAGQSSGYQHNEDRGKVGSKQNTAIRNITGSFDPRSIVGYGVGAFSHVYLSAANSHLFGSPPAYSYSFDASRSVPVGKTNRDNNIAVNHVIFA